MLAGWLAGRVLAGEGDGSELGGTADGAVGVEALGAADEVLHAETARLAAAVRASIKNASRPDRPPGARQEGSVIAFPSLMPGPRSQAQLSKPQPIEPRPPISACAMTVRRMSLVPSPITISGASLYSRSTVNSLEYP